MTRDPNQPLTPEVIRNSYSELSQACHRWVGGKPKKHGTHGSFVVALLSLHSVVCNLKQ